MIEYHADDYGMFRTQSRHIIDCYHNGALNGISIMPNSPYLAECMEEIKDIRKKLFVTVHLNLVEGKPLTGAKASKLVDGDGNFNIGFGKLLLVGFVPVLRKIYYRQIRREMEAQILGCRQYMNDDKFRLDGHVHYHMLPLVFDAIMDVVEQKGLEVSYIRFPREDLNVYRKVSGKLKGIKLINVIKVLVLNALADRNERKHGETLRRLGVQRKFFMGVMLSGHMFYDNVKECIPVAADVLADKGLQDMEILFHPGDITELTEVSQITSKDDLDFLNVNSANRFKEAEALVKFGGGLKR
ncbi:MAG: ChbG/HpnK family deacetylase [Butyrivibrio sp.]|nr:ChbG/HpnK family deacetylase [Butyrivibrio sp.]